MLSETKNILRFNKEIGLYSIEEAGFRYEFPGALYEDFMDYTLKHDFVSRWYNRLNDVDRTSVKRESVYG